jgi:hypothetical protein
MDWATSCVLFAVGMPVPDVQELADPGLLGQEGHRPPKETTVIHGGNTDGRERRRDGVSGLPIGSEVVPAPQPVVVPTRQSSGRGRSWTPSRSGPKRGRSYRPEPDRPRQARLEAPRPVRPTWPTADRPGLRGEHPRRPTPAAGAGLDRTDPLPTRATPPPTRQTPPGQGLRPASTARRGPPPRHRGPHRPQGRRILPTAGPAPLDRRVLPVPGCYATAA